MMGRRFILAVQFLTRLPTPQVRDFDDADLALSARWHPLVGGILGVILWLVILGLHASPMLAAVLALALWAGITGALHLDGLADLADALGAAHADSERFRAVLKDAHLGAFGAVTLMLQLLLKFALLVVIARGTVWLPGIVLIPAWARWGSLFWSRYLPPLQVGMAERFAWHLGHGSIAVWAAVLVVLSALLAPPLMAGLLVVPLLALYLRYRLGGVSGDCLGAAIEVTETLLLLLLALAGL